MASTGGWSFSQELLCQDFGIENKLPRISRLDHGTQL